MTVVIPKFFHKDNNGLLIAKDIDLSNFYSPIGLQTGGDSPEEVAISIAGEILSVYYGNEDINSHMRDSVPENVKYFKK